MTVNVKVEGLSVLEAQLNALGDLPAIRRAGRAALREAGKPMMEKARALAPDDPETGPGKFLKESIKMATGRRDRALDGDQVFVIIGIDQSVDPPVYRQRQRGKGSYRDPGVAGVAGMIEFGTPRAPAQPFMRPAFDSEAEATIRRVGKTLGPAIEREAEKLARRRAKGK